jgi:hypothetical protein
MTFKASISVLLFGFVFTHSIAHVQLDNPKGGETFAPGMDITIKWTESQDHGENNWDLYYTLDDGTVWQEIAIDLVEATLEYFWTIPDAETSLARIKIVQDNSSGTDYEYISENFTISINPPEVEEPEVITALEDITNYSDYDLQLSNYPNPFKGQTTIQFSISRKSHVQLNVYDILGERVFQSVNQVLPEGAHEVLWGNDGLKSGIYLCRLMADNKKISKKMILRP